MLVRQKLALTDGRSLSFEELVAEQEQGKQNFCYTIRQDGKIGVEKIINARITKKDAGVVKVTLDNGEDYSYVLPTIVLCFEMVVIKQQHH